MYTFNQDIYGIVCILEIIKQLGYAAMRLAWCGLWRALLMAVGLF